MTIPRPPAVRIAICTAYVLASAGLLILGLSPDVLFDKWGLVGASSGTLILLAALLLCGNGHLYLGVAGAWIYATVIEFIRVPGSQHRTGLGLILAALAVGALAAYTAWRREAPLRT